MKKVTRWSPDTCGCVIDFEWDTDNPDNAPIGKTIVKSCSAHSVYTKASDAHITVLEENQRKNKTINTITKQLPEFTTTDEKGNKIPDMEKISYSFDKDRKLIVSAVAMKELDKISIKSIVDGIVGIGKVEIS